MLSMLYTDNNPYLSTYINNTNQTVSLQDKEFESLDTMFNYDLDRMKKAMSAGFDLIPDFDTVEELLHWLENTR